ncbi:MAG: single-stranded DNA-binding protein [Oscillospiraceae bacterium]|nr:single-stranded DNA-binding protein [Oscillospiraceae bacterium]
MFNKITLIGRLGRDPEARMTPAGAVANFSLATDEMWLDSQGQKQTRTEWHRVVVWGKQAELCAKYLAKGRLVFVEGSLQTRKYQDDKGQERSVAEVKAQRVLFLDRAAAQSPAQAPLASSPPQAGFPTDVSGMDDLPF